MASNVNPTVRRRRLGQELRRLRELKGMTAEEVAERLLVSQSKISRLENGRRSISQRDVRDLCGVYEVEDHRIVDSLMQMAKDSRQQGWWHSFGDIPYSVYIGLETDAASLRVYDPQVVPGLLQTRAVRGGPHRRARCRRPSAADIDKRVQVRLRRQERISAPDNPLRLWAVLDEAALRRVVGNRPVMREQLEHLVEHVPAPARHRAGDALRGGRASRVSTASTRSWSSPTRRTPAWSTSRASPATCTWRRRTTSRSTRVMYEHLRAQALNVDQSRQFIADIAKEYAR